MEIMEIITRDKAPRQQVEAARRAADAIDAETPAEAQRIKGVQANLWTEFVATPEHLEYMLLPRMFAVSEVQWCQPDRKDAARFTGSVENHQTKILDILGYNYCKTWE